MDDSPVQDVFPYICEYASPPIDIRRSSISRQASPLGSTRRSQTTATTQYAFINETGGESVAASERKRKTVRSHVMKNYLHHQQQARPKESSSSPHRSPHGNGRRKEKMSIRTSRSASNDTSNPTSPSPSGGRLSPEVDRSMFVPGIASFSSFRAVFRRPEEMQRFALDHSCRVPDDAVAAFAFAYKESLVRDRECGLEEASFETLNAKGDAVRIIRDTLSVCGPTVPQSTIFAVTLLAFGCACEKDWDQARAHLEALKQMAESRGGIHTVDFEQQRLSTWVAYYIEAVLQVRPAFPVPLFSDSDPFPLAMLDEARIRSWHTVKRFPKGSSYIFEIVVLMQQLGLATSADYYGNIDQRTLSNLYYEAMRLAAATQVDEPWMETMRTGTQNKELMVMFQVWAAGLPLFVMTTIRHVQGRIGGFGLEKVSTSSYDQLFSKIKGVLDASGGSHAWPRKKSLEPILATLFYCAESCPDTSPWREWCFGTLREVVILLKIKTVEEFKKMLNVFPSTDELRASAASIWSEVGLDY